MLLWLQTMTVTRVIKAEDGVVLDALATKEKYHGKMESVVSTDAAILNKLKTIFDKYIRYEIKCLTYTVFML
jgi:hypothetical protein